jgi:hypothetical protein
MLEGLRLPGPARGREGAMANYGLRGNDHHAAHFSVRTLSALLTALAVLLVALSCAPAAPRSQTGPSENPGGAQVVPDRTLVLAVRGEPPSLAAQELVAFSGSLQRPRELFNAQLDFRDERERPRAQLAEALPQLNSETWRVFPDGRMAIHSCTFIFGNGDLRRQFARKVQVVFRGGT